MKHTTQSQIKVLRTYCQAAAATTLALALMNLSGWAFHIALLTSFSPGHVTTKVNTAICLALASTSLLLLIPAHSGGARGNAARILAVLVLLITAATLSEYIFHVNLGIDQLWINDTMEFYGTSSPGRPAPITAMGLTAAGLALLLLESKKHFALMLAQLLSLCCALVGLIAFDGYIYHAGIPYKLFLYTQVAVPTAIGLLLLSSAIFFVRPLNGIAKELIGNGPGSFMARRFLPAVFITPILFDWICLFGQKAGMYGPEFTPALNATLNTMAFAVLMWSSARQVDREHGRRSEAENEIRTLNVDLECRVAERTVTLHQQATLLAEQATLLDLAQDAIIVLDMNDRISFWNHGAQRMYGWSSEEATGQSLHQLLHMGLAELSNAVEATRLHEKQWESEAVHQRRDGTSIVVGSRWTPQYDALGVAIRILVINNDITRRKHALEVLRQSEENLRSLFQGVKDYAMMSLDAAGRVTTWNEGAQRIEGYSAREIIGQDFSKFYTPEAVAAAHPSEELRIATEQGRFEEEEVRVRKDGSRFWAHVIITALYDHAGQLRGFANVTRDITARKKAESEKLLLTERLSLATSIAKVGVWEWELANDGLVWDATMFEIYGIPVAEMTYKKWAAMVFAEDLAAVEAELQKAIATKNQGAAEFRITRPDGSVRNVSAVEKVYLDDDANVIRVVGVNVDVTERKLAEATREQLLQAQKFESVGQLAAGIAHEINTPVQYIGDNVRFLQDSFGELVTLNAVYARLLAAVRSTEMTPQMLEEITLLVEKIDVDYLFGEIPKAIEQTLEGVSRVAALVGAIKKFSHPGTGEKVPLNLNHAIETTVQVARNEWKYVAELEMELDCTLPLVSCFPGEFNQVVLNMVVNAAHAIADVVARGGPEKGLITIRTRSIPGGVEVQIQDTGGGIPEKIRPRIFDPFFTTKEIGKGTGQGLAIARSVVVDKHQGTIDFETADGCGTTFIIRLPCEAVPDLALA
jgi:PAS domain S-box-containing protein